MKEHTMTLVPLAVEASGLVRTNAANAAVLLRGADAAILVPSIADVYKDSAPDSEYERVIVKNGRYLGRVSRVYRILRDGSRLSGGGDVDARKYLAKAMRAMVLANSPGYYRALASRVQPRLTEAAVVSLTMTISAMYAAADNTAARNIVALYLKDRDNEHIEEFLRIMIESLRQHKEFMGREVHMAEPGELVSLRNQFSRRV